MISIFTANDDFLGDDRKQQLPSGTAAAARPISFIKCKFMNPVSCDSKARRNRTHFPAEKRQMQMALHHHPAWGERTENILKSFGTAGFAFGDFQIWISSELRYSFCNARTERENFFFTVHPRRHCRGQMMTFDSVGSLLERAAKCDTVGECTVKLRMVSDDLWSRLKWIWNLKLLDGLCLLNARQASDPFKKNTPFKPKYTI